MTFRTREVFVLYVCVVCSHFCMHVYVEANIKLVPETGTSAATLAVYVGAREPHAGKSSCLFTNGATSPSPEL